MKLSLDRTLRLVWLAIGVLLLAALAAALVFVAAGLLRTRGATGAAERAASTAYARSLPEPVPGAPLVVRGTSTRIVPLERAASPGYPLSGRREGLANVVFVDPGGGARPLLARPALIRAMRYPVEGADAAAHGPWITYEVVTGGTVRLLASAIDGTALRTVVEPPLRYVAHHPWDAARILVYARDGDRLRAFLYDVAAARLVPLPALDEAVAANGGPHPAR